MKNKNNVLVVTNLTKVFCKRGLFSWLSKVEPFIAVNDISFQLADGEILGLLGPNGSGKTTTLHMLLGSPTPSSGSILYFGKNLETHRGEILQQVAFASTYVGLPPRLTVRENLIVSGGLYGFSGTDLTGRIERFLKKFNLWDRRNHETGSLSAGQKTKLMLVRAFMVEPKIILLDEPTASLDPDVAREVLQFIVEEQKSYGISVLFTSHDMDEVTEVCDRVLVLKNGSIIANDTPSRLAATVFKAHVSLVISSSLEGAQSYLMNSGFTYCMKNRWLEVDVDEHGIAEFLIKLTRSNIEYSAISIKKPDLSDYFFSISGSGLDTTVAK